MNAGVASQPTPARSAVKHRPADSETTPHQGTDSGCSKQTVSPSFTIQPKRYPLPVTAGTVRAGSGRYGRAGGCGSGFPTQLRSEAWRGLARFRCVTGTCRPLMP